MILLVQCAAVLGAEKAFLPDRRALERGLQREARIVSAHRVRVGLPGRRIERHGGEAWLCPISEWILYTALVQRIFDTEPGRSTPLRLLSSLKNLYLFSQEKSFYRAASPLLDDRHEPPIAQVLDEGAKYLPVRFEGEAILTIGRSVYFARQGAVLVVNCAPFGCMPGTLTTAVFGELERSLGTPVVNMFYDGQGQQNKRLQVYLNHYLGR